MRYIVLLPLLIVYALGQVVAPDATTLQTKPLCSVTTTTGCVPFLDGSGALASPLVTLAWDDVVVPLLNIKAPASNPPTYTTYFGSEVPSYSASATNGLDFQVQLPHSYKQGTDIKFHLHTAFPNTGTGNVRWQLTYSWANVDSVFPAVTTVLATVAAPGVADRHAIEPIATIAGTGKNISSVLICSISRIGGDALDTYGSAVYALSADFHFQKDTVGSSTETAK